MREIKFRGKDIDSGEWHYGSLNVSPNGKCDIVVFDDGKIVKYPVNPDTIGQYVGLHDMEGNEIYEGDIIDYYSPFWRSIEYPNKIDPKHLYQLVIVWSPYDCGFGSVLLREALLSPDEQSTSGLTQVSDSYLVGNIHDNPELLKSL